MALGVGVTGIIVGDMVETDILVSTGYFISFAGPPIGATIGFNLTRRYKFPPVSEKALINFNKSKISLSVPTLYSQTDSFDRTLTRRIDFVRVKF